MPDKPAEATLYQFLNNEISFRLGRSLGDRVHVYEGDLVVYVRRGQRLLDREVVDTLTIADMYMRGGSDEGLEEAFKRWFPEAEKLARDRKLSIVFENINGWPWIGKYLAENHFRRLGEPYPLQTDAYRTYRDRL
jgi:hypothetical protein